MHERLRPQHGWDGLRGGPNDDQTGSSQRFADVDLFGPIDPSQDDYDRSITFGHHRTLRFQVLADDPGAFYRLLHFRRCMLFRCAARCPSASSKLT